MCNLYGITSNQEAIRQITAAMIDSIGTLKGFEALTLYPEASTA